MSRTPLCPTVRWAQNENDVFLTVELQNVLDHNIRIAEETVEFRAEADGAKSRNSYQFILNLFGPVLVEQSHYKVDDRYIKVHLRKRHSDDTISRRQRYWTRLTEQTTKLPWLKLDFDKWRDPDEDSEEERDFSNEMRNNFDVNAFEEQQAEQIANEWKRTGLVTVPKVKLTKPYLIMYNALMFVGFFYIVVDLCLGYYKEGTNYFPKAWDQISGKMFCCQIAQFLEIAHALVGYVKSSPLTTTLQTFGRGFVLFVILRSEDRMHDKPFVFYLFLVWSLVEILRYPYYLLSVLNKEVSFLTYLRYTAWIILYPMGFLCEGVILLRAMPFYEETRKFTYPLPNKLNVSFDFPSVLKLYLIFVLLPGAIFLMSHMRHLRVKKLFKKKCD